MIIPPEKSGRQNSAYRHLDMKGVFGNEGALHFLRRQSQPQEFVVLLLVKPATLSRFFREM
jgi:hypothetical protein